LQQNAFVGSRVSRHQMVVVLQFEQWWILLTIGVTVARPVLLVLPLLVFSAVPARFDDPQTD